MNSERKNKHWLARLIPLILVGALVPAISLAESSLTLKVGGDPFVFRNTDTRTIEFESSSQSDLPIIVDLGPASKKSMLARLVSVFKGEGWNLRPVSRLEDSLALRLAGSFAEGVAYESGDGRVSDYHLAKDSELKGLTLYRYGTGEEKEVYSFRNAVLRINDRGDIEGYAVRAPDLSQNAEANNAPNSLLARASRTLLVEQIKFLHEAGGPPPDFVIPKPVAYDKNLKPLEVRTQISGERFDTLEVNFSARADAYPLALDPTLKLASGADFKITGLVNEPPASYQNSFFGRGLVAADLTGDGRVDLAVTGGGTNGPRIYIFKNDGAYPSTAMGADTIIQNDVYSSSFGIDKSLAAGDLNGDGRMDLVAGDYGYSSNRGLVHIFYQDGTWGKSCSGNPMVCLQTGADVTIIGAASGSHFGTNLVVGDFTGDGKGDLAVGSEYDATMTGRVHLFNQDGQHWGAVACAGTFVSPCQSSNADAIFNAEAASNRLGSAIAIGDLNNDGKGDLVLGAFRYSSDAGRIYIFYYDGVSWGNQACTTDCNPGNADNIITGSGNSQQLGAVLALGDLNNDNKLDLVSGSPTYAMSGNVRIFYQDGSWGTQACTTNCMSNNADVNIYGDGNYNNYAYGLAIGDLNNDGKKDIAVSDSGYGQTGRLYLFYQDGVSWGTAPCTFSCSAANADVRITGLDMYNRMGYALAINDFDYDGKNDLVAVSDYTGNVQIFYQDATLWGTVSCTNNCSLANADVRIYGKSENYFLGSAVAIGDLNNDGKDDLAVGEDGYKYSAGRVYIFYQDSTLWGVGSCVSGCDASNADVIVEGENVYNRQFGSVVTLADMDNDGKKDLVVGAEGASRVYLFRQDGTWGSSCSGSPTVCQASSADAIVSGSGSFSKVLAIGDLNNDSKNDLVVSDSGYSSNAGQVYIFYQDSTLWGLYSDTPYATGTALFTNGYTAVTGVGTSWDSSMVGRAIKNNTNGIWHTISAVASATSLTLATSYTGDTTPSEAYTIAGSAASNADAMVAGDASSYFGTSLAIGDLNNDSQADLVVGTSRYPVSYYGRVYIYYRDDGTWGSNCSGSPLVCQAANADAVITGGAANTYLGSSLAVGDLSGDGKRDLAVGAWASNRVYLFTQDGSWGTAPCTTDCSSANADYVIQGEAGQSQYFGTNIALGDIDGDGTGDLVVGPYYSLSAPGRVYGFYQDSTLWGTTSCTTNCSATNADVIVVGESSTDSFGYTFALGRLGADAGSDLAVGAYNRDDANGMTYLFYNLSTGGTRTVSTSVANATPSFTAGPTDDSWTTTPTNAGSNVTFTATATDPNTDSYFLLVCKTGDAPTVGNPPECNGGSGNRWAISASTASGVQATTTYATLTGDIQSNAWYAFVCDTQSCSSVSQGTGDTGSPFTVNHRPAFDGASFSVVETSNLLNVIPSPGQRLRFQCLPTDPDGDKVTPVFCDASGFNDSTRTCNGEELCRADSGAWTSVAGGGGQNLGDIFFLDKDTGWIAVNSPVGRILKTADGGQSWVTKNTGGSEGLYSVYFIDNNIGWAAGYKPGSVNYDGVILKTTDGGDTWTTQLTDVFAGSTKHFRDITCVDEKTCYADGDNVGIWKTSNGGANWTQQSTSGLMMAVRCVDANTCWAVGANGDVKRTINGGTTWSAQTVPWGHYNDVFPLDSNTVWATGENGQVIKTTNGGGAWATIANGLAYRLDKINFVNEIQGWAVGYNGSILSSNDGGVTWNAETGGGAFELMGLFVLDKDTAWAVGLGGSIYRMRKSVAPASKWTAETTGLAPSDTPRDIAFIDDKTGWFVGYLSGGNGMIYKTTDGGSNWSNQTPGTINRLYAVDFIDKNTGYAVGELGTILKTANGGANWNSQSGGSGSGVTWDVECVDVNTCWTVGDGGQIRYTANGGATAWVSQTSGTTQWLSGVSFVDANQGWAVGGNGTILKTTDAGTNWSAQTSGTTQGLISVYFVDKNTGYAVGYAGILLKTSDGGANWIAQTSGTTELLRKVYFIDSKVGFVSGDLGGNLLYTIDGGSTWNSQATGAPSGLGMYFVDKAHGWIFSSGGVWDGVGLMYCDETDTAPSNLFIKIPTPHGPKAYTVQGFDAHNFVDDGTTENRSFSVKDVPPTITSASQYTYSPPDTNMNIALSAGASVVKTYRITISDNNGDNDIVTPRGVLYDDDAIDLSSGTCTADERNCYPNVACSLNNNGGADTDALSLCDFTVWFNANASDLSGQDWRLHMNAADDQGTVTTFTDSNAIQVSALQAINIPEATIAYGALALGAISSGQAVTIQNMGNQLIDVLVQGTAMTGTPSGSIAASQQKWLTATQNFIFALGNTLVTDASGATTKAGGCSDRNQAVRANHASGTGSDVAMYWKLQIPSSQTAGSYAGTNTFTATSSGQCSDGFVSYGGESYPIVQIGTQTWLGKSLNIGTRVAGTTEQTNNAVVEKYCYGDSDADCATYGAFYQWDEAMSYSQSEGAQGICPAGWHIPTDAEWDTLLTYLGGSGVAGNALRETGTSHWNSPNTGATNASGFTCLGSGYRVTNGSFTYRGTDAIFWTSKVIDSTNAWNRHVYNNSGALSHDPNPRISGYSVRCIKN